MKVLDIRGVKVPALGFGTWRLKGRTCRDMVRQAVKIGYRHIDTASIYDNEEDVGRGIADAGVPREEIFLVTKVWRDQMAVDSISRAAAESRERLGTEYIDLFLIHWPTRSVPLAETLRGMRHLMEDGRIRHIGVSNFPVALLQEATETLAAPILANQVEYHPYLSQNRLVAYCREAGIMLTAYCPLAEGQVTRDPLLKRIGAKHGRSAAQVALRWLLEQHPVAAIPMTASPDHCRANFEVFDFELEPEDRAAIAGLACNRRLIDMGTGYAWDAD
jgi:2,5-diketo-D-gluconate reductase B